jgi:hypothetical protein
MDMSFLDRRACCLTHPRVSIGQFAEVWTTRLRHEDVAAGKVVPSFLYFSRTDGEGQVVGDDVFALEIELYSLFRLKIVKTYVKHGQTVNEEGGTWEGLWLPQVALQAWLNENHYIESIPNWVQMVSEWNMAHPNQFVLTEYAVGKVLNLMVYNYAFLRSCAFPKIQFV